MGSLLENGLHVCRSVCVCVRRVIPHALVNKVFFFFKKKQNAAEKGHSGTNERFLFLYISILHFCPVSRHEHSQIVRYCSARKTDNKR